MTLLTIKEACGLYRVGYQTVYAAAKRGEIEAYKPGRELLLDPVSVDKWFKSKKINIKRPAGRPRKHGRDV